MTLQFAELRDLSTAFPLMETARFKAQTLEDVGSLSHFAAGFFGDPERVQAGLYELLLNALEHGCLELGYAQKTKLAAAGLWETEVRRRLTLPEYQGRAVDLVVARKGQDVFAVITDPGRGFDWKEWVYADPSRAAGNGRGILRAKSANFDTLAYNPAGNQVVAHCRDTGDIQW